MSSLLEIPFRTLFLLKSLFFSKILLKLKEPTCYTRSRNQRIIKKWRVTNERKQLQQKKRRILWGWILAVLLLSISMGTVNVQAAKLKLNKTKVTVYKGCTETLKVTGSKKKVKWSSSKKAVASVSSSGKIKGKKKGTTVIYAKVGNKL